MRIDVEPDTTDVFVVASNRPAALLVRIFDGTIWRWCEYFIDVDIISLCGNAKTIEFAWTGQWRIDAMASLKDAARAPYGLCAIARPVVIGAFCRGFCCSINQSVNVSFVRLYCSLLPAVCSYIFFVHHCSMIPGVVFVPDCDAFVQNRTIRALSLPGNGSQLVLDLAHARVVVSRAVVVGLSNVTCVDDGLFLSFADFTGSVYRSRLDRARWLPSMSVQYFSFFNNIVGVGNVDRLRLTFEATTSCSFKIDFVRVVGSFDEKWNPIPMSGMIEHPFFPLSFLDHACSSETMSTSSGKLPGDFALRTNNATLPTRRARTLLAPRSASTVVVDGVGVLLGPGASTSGNATAIDVIDVCNATQCAAFDEALPLGVRFGNVGTSTMSAANGVVTLFDGVDASSGAPTFRYYHRAMSTASATWRSTAMAAARVDGCVVATSTTMFYGGGRNDVGVLATIERLDATSGGALNVSLLAASLSAARARCGCALVTRATTDVALLFVGGWLGGNASDVVDEIALSSDGGAALRRSSRLSRAVVGASVASVGGVVVVTGGSFATINNDLSSSSASATMARGAFDYGANSAVEVMQTNGEWTFVANALTSFRDPSRPVQVGIWIVVVSRLI